MTDWAGRQISHYRVISQLGQGGMGVVYLAQDVNIGRRVVLKLLKADLASDPRMEERFHREARASAAVAHPNITTIYEVNQYEGSWYICMEFLEGETLRSLIGRRGALPFAEAVRIAASTADALGAAHEVGIVHRDMKPENIMITSAGQVKVLDFGLAAFTDALIRPPDIGALETAVDRLTGHGVAIGTLHYMSPEQAAGRAVTPASDVFSLGTVLYETVTGFPPFRGETSLAVLHAIAYDQPPLLSTRRPDVPPALDRAVRRALRKDATQRFSSGRAMRDELLRVLPSHELEVTGSREALRPPASGADPSLVGSLETVVKADGFKSDLVGRHQEMRTLMARLDQAIAGEGSLVLISGEAGVGKTRLVNEMARRGELRGAGFLQGRCLFREGGLPYHPFLEAAGQLIAYLGLDEEDAFERYVNERMPQLAGRLPILKSFLHVAGQESSAALIADKDHLLDAICALFLAFARQRPMILFVDDLHWADEASLDLLQYLARSCRQSQGIIVGTYRPEELDESGAPAHPLGRLLDRMSAGDLYTEIKLGRLGASDTATIISSTLDGARLDSDFIDLLYHETAGNPFYVLETIRLLIEDGTLKQEQGSWKLTQSLERVTIPGRVHDVVTRRLSRVSSIDREVLEIAAAEGMVFHSDTIASCLGSPRIRVLGALQRAEKEHHLIHAEQERYTFDHPLIREILYETIIPELRSEYHRLMGDYLSANRAGRPGVDASIAYQYLEAGQEEAALPFLIEAGARARRLYANAEALTALNRAETILTTLEDVALPRAAIPGDRLALAIRLRKERGALHQRLGEHDRAMSDYLAMQRIATVAALPQKQAHALCLMAELYYAMGEYDQAFERARLAQELAMQAGDKKSLSNALRVMGEIHFYRAEYDQALTAHNQSIDLQRQTDDIAGYAENLNKVGNIHLTRGDRDKADMVYKAALALGRQSGNRLAAAESLNNLGVLHYYGGEADAALEHLEECLAIKREIGDRRSLARSLSNLGMVLEMRGDLAAAVTTHQEALALIRGINDQGSIITALNNLTSVHYRMGRYGDALAVSEESLAICEAIGDRWFKPYALNSLGRIRLRLNQPREAATLFERALEMTRQQGHRVEQCQSIQNLGAARAALGDLDEGLALLRQARDLAAEVQAREHEGETLYIMGLLLAARGDIEATAACARQLRELGEALRSREAEIRRLHLEGCRDLLQNRGDEAAGGLSQAADLAAQVGLKELEWRIRRDLSLALVKGPAAAEEMLKAALIIRELADQAGSPELSRIYLSDRIRRAVLEEAAGHSHY